LAAVTWRMLGAWTLRIGGVVLAVAGSALLAG